MREVSLPMVKPTASQHRDSGAPERSSSIRTTAFGDAMRSVMLQRPMTRGTPDAPGSAPREAPAPTPGSGAISTHLLRMRQRVEGNQELADRVSATVEETLAKQAASKAASRAELEAEDRATRGDGDSGAYNAGIASVLARLITSNDGSSGTVATAPSWVRDANATGQASVSEAAAKVADAVAGLHTPTEQPAQPKPKVQESAEDAAAHKPPEIAWAERLRQTRGSAAIPTVESRATAGSDSAKLSLGSFFNRPGMATQVGATSGSVAGTDAAEHSVPAATATASQQVTTDPAADAATGVVPDDVLMTHSPFLNGMSRPWRSARVAPETAAPQPTAPAPTAPVLGGMIAGNPFAGPPATSPAPGTSPAAAPPTVLAATSAAATATPAPEAEPNVPAASAAATQQAAVEAESNVGAAATAAPAIPARWLARGNPFGGRQTTEPATHGVASPAASSPPPPAVAEDTPMAQRPFASPFGSPLTTPRSATPDDVTPPGVTAPADPAPAAPHRIDARQTSEGAPSAGVSAWPAKLTGIIAPDDSAASGGTPPPTSEPSATAPAPIPVAPAPQTVRHVASAPAAMPVTGAAAPVHHQIVSAVGPLLSGPDGSYQLQLNLDPGSLGPVRLTVDLRGGEVSIVMQAGNADTGDLLRENLDNLRQQLQAQGINAGTVDVGTGQGQQSFAQSFHRNPFAARPTTQGTPTAADDTLTPTSSPNTSTSTGTHDLDVSM